MKDLNKRYNMQGLTHSNMHMLNIALAHSVQDNSPAQTNLGPTISLFLGNKGKETSSPFKAPYNFVTVIGTSTPIKTGKNFRDQRVYARVTAFDVSEKNIRVVEKILQKPAPRSLWQATKDMLNPFCETNMPASWQSDDFKVKSNVLKTLEIERCLSEEAVIVCSTLVDEFVGNTASKAILSDKSSPMFDMLQGLKSGQQLPVPFSRSYAHA